MKKKEEKKVVNSDVCFQGQTRVTRGEDGLTVEYGVYIPEGIFGGLPEGFIDKVNTRLCAFGLL